MIRFGRAPRPSVFEVPTAGAFGSTLLVLALLAGGLVVLRRS